MWLKTLFITRCYKIFNSKIVLILSATALQLVFAGKLLRESNDDVGFREQNLIKNALSATIAYMLI